MAGTLVIDTLKSSTTSPPAFQNTSGTVIGTLCRAWVSFAGSTGTVSGSFNVSSVTRNGTGDYTVNFTNAMPDTTYAVGLAFGQSATSTPYAPQYLTGGKATGSVRVAAYSFDPLEYSVSVNR